MQLKFFNLNSTQFDQKKAKIIERMAKLMNISASRIELIFKAASTNRPTYRPTYSPTWPTSSPTYDARRRRRRAATTWAPVYLRRRRYATRTPTRATYAPIDVARRRRAVYVPTTYVTRRRRRRSSVYVPPAYVPGRRRRTYVASRRRRSYSSYSRSYRRRRGGRRLLMMPQLQSLEVPGQLQEEESSDASRSEQDVDFVDLGTFGSGDSTVEAKIKDATPEEEAQAKLVLAGSELTKELAEDGLTLDSASILTPSQLLSSTNTNENEKSSSTVAIVLGCIGGLFVAMVLVALVGYFVYSRRGQASNSEKSLLAE
jgi:hypothetical protein